MKQVTVVIAYAPFDNMNVIEANLKINIVD